jgi:CheY-like chemotaxis protein
MLKRQRCIFRPIGVKKMATSICKVLVVDDKKDVRSTIAGVLSDAGHFVKTAGGKVEAISVLTEETFHFVVIDIRLRGDEDEDESGVELAKTIREHGIRSKIIFITGKKVKGSHVESVLEYGVIGYIEKEGDWIDSVRKTIEKNFMKFDVFLCHNSEDKSIIKSIGNKLKRRGLRPWLDQWELPPGLPWQELVEEQIEEIKSAAVFVGESGLGPWQEMEVRGLLSEFVKRKCPVIPVLLSYVPKKPILPLFLREMTWVNFRENTPDPMQQLIWGITGKKK